LRSFEIVLDELFRVPGTRIRFGIDGLIGFVPGVGDALGGLLSLVIPFAAWLRGVPYAAILRMAVNIGIGVLVGVIPIAGDIFDIFWKTNRRNLRLLHRHLSQPRRHSWRDWVFLVVVCVTLGAIIASPVLLLVWLLFRLFHLLG
jgi:hypothetical protein